MTTREDFTVFLNGLPARLEPAPTFTKVRYPEIELGRFGARHWQYVDADGRGQVGPIYATKLEALADLERYIVAGGWVIR